MGTGTRTMDQAIEEAENNIIWMSKNYQLIQVLLVRDSENSKSNVNVPR